MSSYCLMFLEFRSFLMFSGFGLKPPASGFHFYALEKEMATHSSVFAWRIPEKGEPGGLPSLGVCRVGRD